MQDAQPPSLKQQMVVVPALSRRGFLLGSAAGALGPAIVTAKNKVKSPSCTLAVEQTEGPFYLDNAAVRSDITEEKPGIPLRLQIAIVHAESCAPLPNIAVDLWHCDAGGIYSGFASSGRPFPTGNGKRPFPPPQPLDGFFGDRNEGGPPRPFHRQATNGLRYLRGVSMTDNDGVASFVTIYPGWYAGRAIHIHLKVHTSFNGASRNLASHVCHTGQLFLPEDVSDGVMKTGVYAKHAGERMRQSEDGIFESAHDPGVILSLERNDGRRIDGGFSANTIVGVDPLAEPRPVGPGGSGRPRPPFGDHA